MSTHIDGALDKLAAEDSAAQVAVRLEVDGCIGIRYSYGTCPVAEWLLATTGHRVLVSPYCWCSETDDFAYGCLPDPVAEFVQEFDREHFPRLDDAAIP